VNGDFETGIGTNTTGGVIPGWSDPTNGQSLYRERLEIQSAIVRSGSGALLITAVPTPLDPSNSIAASLPLVQRPPIVPGTTYYFSAWNRQSIPGACRARWTVGSSTLMNSETTLSDSAWARTDIIWTASATDTQVFVQLTTICKAGTAAWAGVYVDDAYFGTSPL